MTAPEGEVPRPVTVPEGEVARPVTASDSESPLVAPDQETTQFDQPTPILDDALWISGCPIDYAWLEEHRINLVVDVADPELRLEPSRLGPIVYCKEALVDGPELPEATIIDRLVRDVVTAVRDGKRVLVACAGGRNRSGLVVALAVRDILGCSGAEAVQLVQSRRESALNNVTFAQHVASLARPERRPSRPTT